MPTTRHTSQHQAVLRAVKLSAEPVLAADLVRRLQPVGLSRATVFRALKYYTAQGEIAVIDSADGRPAYVGHTYHIARFRCQRCGKERHLNSQTLPTYVDRKMFGHQSIVTSQLIAQGLCGSCAKKTHVAT